MHSILASYALSARLQDYFKLADRVKRIAAEASSDARVRILLGLPHAHRTRINASHRGKPEEISDQYRGQHGVNTPTVKRPNYLA